ncbi:hypothetical protein ES703_40624 [subsurface metagenome]
MEREPAKCSSKGAAIILIIKLKGTKMKEKKKKPRTLNTPQQFMFHALKESIFHPKRPITYLYCPDCKLRFPCNEQECPKCGKKVGESPEVRQTSPAPWWGSLICIVIGIASWVISAVLSIPGLDEAARALVYIPLGSLFGMSLAHSR